MTGSQGAASPVADATPAARLWSFSLRVYALPEVAPACLRCQDEAGADVNVVLLLLWAASEGRRVESGALLRLDGAVAEWRRQVVEPLRALRRFLKERDPDPSGAFRQAVKQVELDAERWEQSLLCQAFGAPDENPLEPSRHLADENLRAYEEGLGRSLPREARARLIASVSGPSGESDLDGQRRAALPSGSAS